MKNQSPSKPAGWTNVQIFTAIIVAIVLGCAAGYLIHSSSSSTPESPAAASVPAQNGVAQAVQEEIRQLQARVQANPRDVSALTELGNIYFDNQQWPMAIDFYTRSLNEAPKNPDVRTDMGIAYFYSGDPDRALREFDQALKDDPTHVQTLYNVGVVKKDGKHDPKGAITAWESLLKIDPQYKDRAKVEAMMAQAKAQAK